MVDVEDVDEVPVLVEDDKDVEDDEGTDDEEVVMEEEVVSNEKTTFPEEVKEAETAAAAPETIP